MVNDPLDSVHGPIHTVVCTDTNPYGTWQTEFLEHSWVRSAMPGELIRLVGAAEDEPLPVHPTARVIRTSATNRHPDLDGDYTPINRLLSLAEWLDQHRPVGTVLIVDCDMVFRAPIERRALVGHPIGQHWWDFSWANGGSWAQVADDLSPTTIGARQSVTWPLLIHTYDLRRVIGRWIELTVAIRTATGAWESDMVALPMVLAEHGLNCDLEMLAAWMNWPDEVVGDAPVIHYCQPVLDIDDNDIWYKQAYQPWSAIGVDPSKAALSYCRDLLTMLDKFAALRRRVTRLRPVEPTGPSE